VPLSFVTSVMVTAPVTMTAEAKKSWSIACEASSAVARRGRRSRSRPDVNLTRRLRRRLEVSRLTFAVRRDANELMVESMVAAAAVT
jgi:hypothetical protein